MTHQQQQEFDSKKNTRATIYTVLVVGAILGICMMMSWSLPPLPEKPLDEGIEVNLGSSDMGSGTDQPFEPGPPAPTTQPTYTPPAPVNTKDDDVKDIETDDKDEDAPVIKKPVEVKKDATKVPEKDIAKTKPTVKPQPAVPTPPVRKPKAVAPKNLGGTGTGGNDADQFKKGGSEGIAGGQGDQGRPGGDPDSKNYTGGGKGSGGVSMISGDRKIVKWPSSFTGDFDRNATVNAEIRVSASGIGEFSRAVRGSTSTDEKYISEIRKKLKEMKFDAKGVESVVTLKFVFKVTQ
jgi:hypothetical protein